MKKSTAYFVLTLLLTMLFVGCTKDSDPQSPAPTENTYTGIVIDAETGLPIPGVVLTFDDGEGNVTTGTDGSFIIRSFESLLRLVANKDGYERYQITIVITTGNPTTVLIKLRKINDDVFEGSLIAYYPLDGSADDNGLFNLDGTATRITWGADRNGGANKAAEFVSSNAAQIDVAYDSRFNLDEFTYAFWMKAGNPIGTMLNGQVELVSRWGHWGPNYQTHRIWLNESMQIGATFFNRVNGNNYGSVNSPVNSIAAGEWIHVAVTYKNAYSKIFLNGQLSAEGPVVDMQESYYYGVRFGNLLEGTAGQVMYFNGMMDEIRIYSKAFDASDINIIKNM